MTKSFFGCTYTEAWASPSDWKTTTSKKALQKNWYVQISFHDPAFPDKEPKGFQWRKRLNRIDNLDDRRAAIEMLFSEMPEALKKGYNPITKQFMVPQDVFVPGDENTINRETPFTYALNFALTMHQGNEDTRKDIKSMLQYFNKACIAVKISTIPVCNIRGYHIRQAMEAMPSVKAGFTDKRYNKYIAYLSSLFSQLASDGLTDINPLYKYRKKITHTEKRSTLTLEERIKINDHLKENHYNFWIYANLFFHSGGREVELLKLRYEDINLKELSYRTMVNKGGRSRWVNRPVKEIAVPFWIKALTGAKKGDVIFSVGLVPGTTVIRRDQITRRWRTHVKEKLGITVDFYALKHSNLDEIAEQHGLQEAARAAGHTTTEMVSKHYAVGEEDRKNKRVQQMTNLFAPGAAL